MQKEIIQKDNNPKNNFISNQNLTPVIKSNPIFEKEVQELGESNKKKGLTNNEQTTVDKVIDNATDKTVDMIWVYYIFIKIWVTINKKLNIYSFLIFVFGYSDKKINFLFRKMINFKKE